MGFVLFILCLFLAAHYVPIKTGYDSGAGGVTTRLENIVYRYTNPAFILSPFGDSMFVILPGSSAEVSAGDLVIGDVYLVNGLQETKLFDDDPLMSTITMVWFDENYIVKAGGQNEACICRNVTYWDVSKIALALSSVYNYYSIGAKRYPGGEEVINFSWH